MKQMLWRVAPVRRELGELFGVALKADNIAGGQHELGERRREGLAVAEDSEDLNIEIFGQRGGESGLADTFGLGEEDGIGEVLGDVENLGETLPGAAIRYEPDAK